MDDISARERVLQAKPAAQAIYMYISPAGPPFGKLQSIVLYLSEKSGLSIRDSSIVHQNIFPDTT